MKLLFLFSLLFYFVLGDEKMSIYDFEVKTIEGKNITLQQYKNRVLLIVNVASRCGFTYQYEGLQALHKKYNNEGLSILGFPSNQFLQQEPGTNDEIKSFCTLNYGVEFDMFSKIDVNGEHEHALYTYLKKEAKGILGTQNIKWNFTKFLIDKNGNVIERYGSSVKPKEIENDIIRLLKHPKD